jgi:hypothetical protein
MEQSMGNDQDPFEGVAIGIAWADSDAKAEQHGRDLAEMKAILAKKSKTVLLQEAMKNAAADVVDEITAELKQVDAGALSQRRMSDPKNAEARNTAFAEAAAKHVNRLSGGKVRLSDEKVDQLRNARSFK